jgi:hypothetical protein
MKFITVFLVTLVVGMNAAAVIVLEDPFDTGNLATFTNGVNGGFTVIGSGGVAEEEGDIARISNAQNGTDFGILSTGTFSLSGADELKTTWIISDSDLKNNAKSLTFVWQQEAVLNATDPELSLILDLDTEDAYFLRDGTVVTNDSLEATFGMVGDAFVVAATFSLTGGDVGGSGALQNGGPPSTDLNLGALWGGSAPTLANLHVGAFANGKGNNAMVIEFDSVTVETIPEPAVISLIGLFGGGMIFSRRIFGRKKNGSNE